MSDFDKDNLIVEVISGLVILGILFAFLFIIHIHDSNVWNNGYHSCGGKWEYLQPVGHAYSTYYLYECDKCGRTHEFSIKR